MSNKFNIPLTDRTFARSKGCWNCKHAGTPDVGVAYFRSSCRPRDEARIASLKIQLADIPPTLGLGDAASRANDAKRDGLLRMIEENTTMLDALEKAVADGKAIRCINPRCANDGDFKSFRFLCDQWSGVTGASLASKGTATEDMLPEELKDRVGDGN